MKKRIAILLLVCFALLALSGCGDKYPDSPYLGTWEAGTIEYMGMEFDVTSLLGGEFNITLEASGKAGTSIVGDTASGKWEPVDGGVRLFDSSDDDMLFEDTGDGRLSLEQDGMTIYFTK